MSKEQEKYVGEPMKTLSLLQLKENQIKNIYQRISSVMADVEYIQKTEPAAKGLPYNFISHDQVTGALHAPMVKHGIVAITDILEMTQEGNRTSAKVKVSFVNIDLPLDRVDVISYGYGIDAQDKGPGKAISYATKMAYLKCFMLETGCDPERSNVDFDEEPTIDEDQSKEVAALINGDIKTWKMLEEKFGFKKISLITKKKYSSVLTHLRLLKMQKDYLEVNNGK